MTTGTRPTAIGSSTGVPLPARSGGFTFEPFVRVNNINNKAYIGSLIVNGSGGRYYEPAPKHNWLAGLGMEYSLGLSRPCYQNPSVGSCRQKFLGHASLLHRSVTVAEPLLPRVCQR